MASTNTNNSNIGSNVSTDFSDFNITAGNSAQTSPVQLPIRGEKRIIPCPISPSDTSSQIEKAYTALGQKSPQDKGYAATGRTSLVQYSDFFTVGAMKPFVDYVLVRIPHRGVTSTGQQNGNAPAAIFRFLINPSQVQINRQTLDGQAMTRAGWQIGVWGEDSFQVNLSGKTAGQYFAFGVTDQFQPFSDSYRNLESLVMVFENNGYWFEGEQAAEGPLAADFTRRRIKMHQDVELWVGNFIWYGMFDSLTISQSAEAPWLMNFQISFIAWKERFRSTSPYQNLILNDVQRGHTYGAWASAATTSQNGTTTTSSLTNLPPPNIPGTNISSVGFSTLNSQPALVSPSVAAANVNNTLPQVAPTSVDNMANTSFLLNPTSVAASNFYNGVS